VFGALAICPSSSSIGMLGVEFSTKLKLDLDSSVVVGLLTDMSTWSSLAKPAGDLCSAYKSLEVGLLCYTGY
jgi:hypothetical protein